MFLQVGQMLYGYCGGIFGRDHYNDCRVEGTGVDWVVVRNESDDVDFASGMGIHDELAQYTDPKESYS